MSEFIQELFREWPGLNALLMFLIFVTCYAIGDWWKERGSK